VAQWAAASEQACRLDHIEHARPSDLADRAAQCFDDARESIDAALQRLTRPGPLAVERALPTIDSLPSVESCTREADLRDVRPLPHEPELRAQVIAISHELTRNDARWLDDDDADGLALARSLATRADELDWLPLRAEAWLQVGTYAISLHEAQPARAAFEQALTLALRAGSDELAIRATIGLIRQSDDASDRARIQAERWGWLGKTLLARSPSPNAGLESDLLRTLADTYHGAPEHADEERLLARALELAEEYYGPRHSKVGSLSYRLGSVRHKQRRNDEAIALLERAREIQAQALGPGHSFVGQVLAMLAITLQDAGRHDEALAAAKQAVAVVEGALGPEHIDLAGPLNYLASIHSFGGETELALRAGDRSLAILERNDDPAARYNLAIGRLNRGVAAFIREDYAAALPDLYRALAVYRELKESDDGKVGQIYMVLGAAYRGLGDGVLARGLLARAAAVFASHPDALESAFVSSYAGDAELLLGDRVAALAHYEQAMAACDRLECSGQQRADLRFRVAHVLEQLGRDRDRAAALLEEATAAVARLPATDRQNVADGVATWRKRYADPRSTRNVRAAGPPRTHE
jgi:tetratricopeptide (TPR) repeat protein